MTTVDMVADPLDEQRKEFVQLAREFAESEIAPHAAGWDQRKEFPRDVIRRLGELGFLGLLVSEDLDGLGVDTLTYLMMMEEIAAADASVSITLSVHNSLPSYVLQRYGTPEQHEQITAIVTAALEDLGGLREQHHEQGRAFAAEMRKPTIDRAAIEELRQQGLELAEEGSRRLVEGLADAAELLTPEQRNELVELVERFHEH